MKVTFLITALILALPVASHQEPEEGELIARVAPGIIKRAHRYHGIDTSVMDAEGRLYFWRDGKQCKLFTNDFLREGSYEKRAKIKSKNYYDDNKRQYFSVYGTTNP